ncbi:MAG: hypothetical protein Q8O22_05475 [Candidatus Omnitrophota bacterium]|nr:hypothetical protein [Candidatus Omnitrophota bacterium]
MYFVKFRKEAADSLAEYALVLGVLALVFIGMNMHIKGGFQGKMKEMSDRFISRQQADEMDSARVADSLSRPAPPKHIASGQLSGGSAIQAVISDETRGRIQRHSITKAEP